MYHVQCYSFVNISREEKCIVYIKCNIKVLKNMECGIKKAYEVRIENGKKKKKCWEKVKSPNVGNACVLPTWMRTKLSLIWGIVCYHVTFFFASIHTQQQCFIEIKSNLYPNRPNKNVWLSYRFHEVKLSNSHFLIYVIVE